MRAGPGRLCVPPRAQCPAPAQPKLNRRRRAALQVPGFAVKSRGIDVPDPICVDVSDTEVCDVFISYGRQDGRPEATALRAALAVVGVRAYLAENLEAFDWATRLFSALDSAKVAETSAIRYE